jgi:hypothetical protein
MVDRDEDIPLTDEELAQRGAELIAAAMTHPEARAPQALRASLERIAEPAPGRRRPRRWLVAPGLAAICVLAVALVVALGGSDDGVESPSVQEVAAVTRLPARDAAPAALGGRPPRLSAAVVGLAVPDWRKSFGWKATGRRSDRIANRTVTTVFYAYSGRPRLGYAIVAGVPLAPGAGRDVVRGGARYRVVVRGGRRTVTWTQAGHTCVIDAPTSVAAATLVRLADSANA